jgi:hypothetical protein
MEKIGELQTLVSNLSLGYLTLRDEVHVLVSFRNFP